MKKEGSTASMLWLDIRRGFCSKRFWGIVGVVTIVFVVFLTLDIIYPLQKYYNGYGTFDWKLDSISMAPFAVRIGILYMGVPREQVVPLLIPAILPVNLLKGGINTALTLLLYKPIVTALRKANLIPQSENHSKGGFNAWGMAIGVFILLSCIVAIILFNK